MRYPQYPRIDEAEVSEEQRAIDQITHPAPRPHEKTASAGNSSTPSLSRSLAPADPAVLQADLREFQLGIQALRQQRLRSIRIDKSLLPLHIKDML